MVAENNQNNEEKIAYIYICHNNPDLLARVANILEYKSDAIFVHVDKKVDITSFVNACKKKSNVYFVENRVENYWGGFNSIVATMETFKVALEQGTFTRFVVLQGQDYPIVSPEDIHGFFKKNANIEFCKARDISISSEKRDYIKWSGYWLMDLPDKFFFKIIRSIIGRFNCLGIKYRSGIFKYNNNDWHVYHGWAQVCLTRECIKHIVDIYENCDEFNKFIKHRFPPDEIYIQTIVHNSRFKENVSKDEILYRTGEKSMLNCTYFEYPKQVTVFTEKSDWEWLCKTGCLFVRKVSNGKSRTLLDRIDRNIVRNNH